MTAEQKLSQTKLARKITGAAHNVARQWNADPDDIEQEMVLADTPDAFAAAVVGLLGSPEQREKLGRAGRRFVEERYDWSVIVPQVEAVYGRWEQTSTQ